MRLFKVALLAGIEKVTSLSCHTCHGGPDVECPLKECPRDGQEYACQNEIRTHNGRYEVKKMCKQKMACDNNSIQNDRAAWVPTQCNPIFHANSVCRCCCSDVDGCNKKDDFCFETPRCPEIIKTPNLEYKCSNDREMGSKCSFSCVNGDPEKYDLELVGSETATCKMRDIGAMWTPDQPYCKRIYKCPLENPPSPMTQSCTNGNLVKSTCTLSCPPTHRYIGPGGSRTCRQAGDSAFWDNDFGKCEAMCEMIPEISNGHHSCTNMNFIGSECTFKCNGGYTLNGASTKTCKSSTTPRGAEWEASGLEPRCDPVCDALGEPENGRLVCTGREIGETCETVCDEGYNLIGPSIRTCQSDINGWNGVQWDLEPAYCQPKCPEVKKVENTVVSCSSSTDLGSVCNFVCIQGYEMVGSPKTTCMLNVNDGSANWDQHEPSCQLLCNKVIEIENGKVECDSDVDSISNRCKYSCNDGYILRGDDETTCVLTDDGKQAIWDTTPPYCEPVCNHPEEPEGGSYECNGHEIGSECNFSCDSDASRMDGEPSLICKEDQFGKAYWSGQRATCIPQCPQRVIHTPPMTVNCTQGRDVGSYCDFDCTDEGQLMGSSRVKCQIGENGDAVWSHEFPECQPSCPQFASREGRSIDCTDGRLGGSECEFSCDPNGWKLSGNSTLYCKVHRVQVENSELPLPNSMNRDAFNMQVSATKQVALWNLPEPVCKRKSCPKLVLTNGQLACTGNLFEDNCKFKCNEGFTLKGEDRASCTGFGRWSNRLPICEKTPLSMLGECPVLDLNPNVVLDCSLDNYKGSVCAFSCPTGFELIGPGLASCDDDLNWTDTIPICKMRVMISKWIIDKVTQRNPTLQEFIENYGDLNKYLVQGRDSKDVPDAIIDFQSFIAQKCGADVHECDATNECLQDTFVEIFKMETVDGRTTFEDSYNQRCPNSDMA